MTVGKLSQLSAIPGMPSPPTLRRFIRSRSDFPVIQQGGNGVEYSFDLAVAAEFVRTHWRDSRSKLSGLARAGRTAVERPTLLVGRTGTLAELADIPDMPSQPTLLAFIRSRPDFPVVEHGRKGVAYVLDLEAAATFVRANWRDNRSVNGDRSAASDRQSPASQAELPDLFSFADWGEDGGVS